MNAFCSVKTVVTLAQDAATAGGAAAAARAAHHPPRYQAPERLHHCPGNLTDLTQSVSKSFCKKSIPTRIQLILYISNSG